MESFIYKTSIQTSQEKMSRMLVQKNKVYLSLGSNLGDRRQNLVTALNHLLGVFPNSKWEVSPVYETPALLPDRASPSWNLPYLNLVVGISEEFEKRRLQIEDPSLLLRQLKQIEKIMGREPGHRWAPRCIDIDLLWWNGLKVNTQDLTLPHSEMFQRSFVMDPLKDLNPQLVGAARQLPHHSPLWMAILNITPDSFSDGGYYKNLEDIDDFLKIIEDQVGILDIGAESTRPGATPLSWQEEWSRLEPVLKYLKDRYFKSKWLRPLISVDTRHSEIASLAISDFKVDIINDVSGLADKAMIELLIQNNCQYVLTHSLSVPANPSVALPNDNIPAHLQVKKYFTERLEYIASFGIPKEKIILDPGIGFGKTNLQSLDILRNINQFFDFPCRILVGHSRKSFLKGNATQNRDLISVGVSLNLAARGVDILRVHNPIAHLETFQGFQQLGGRL